MWWAQQRHLVFETPGPPNGVGARQQTRCMPIEPAGSDVRGCDQYVVKARRGDRLRTYWLDRSLGLAVSRWTEHRGGSLFRTVAATDFTDVCGVYWPRRVEVLWYGFVTKGAEVLAEPGMRVVHTVSEIGDYAGDDTFQVEFRPGTAVYDMRHGDSETSYHGYLAHLVAVPPGEMVARFHAGWQGEPMAQRPAWLSLIAYGVVGLAIGWMLRRGAR
jgi:hypothetical protein